MFIQWNFLNFEKHAQSSKFRLSCLLTNLLCGLASLFQCEYDRHSCSSSNVFGYKNAISRNVLVIEDFVY